MESSAEDDARAAVAEVMELSRAFWWDWRAVAVAPADERDDG